MALALVGFVSGFVSPGLQAQNYDNPGLGELPATAHPQDFKPLGIRAGGFMLHPGAQLAAEFTDNVFFTTEDEISDTVWHVRPYVSAQSDWSRHSFNIRLAADIARHQDFSVRDYEDYFLLVDGEVDVRARSFLSYSLDYMNLHEGLNTRDAEQGLEPTRYDLYGGSIGYDHTFNRLTLGLKYGLRKLDFDDAFAEDGSVIRNQDRDRKENDVTLRASYLLKTDKQVFVELTHNDVEYDEAIDRNAFDRSSDGYTASAGLMLTLTGVLTGDVFVSYHDQDFEDPLLPNVKGWAGGAGLQWKPTRLTTVAARIRSGVEATTNRFSSGYLGTVYSVRVDHELLRNLQISGQVSYRNNDYELLQGAPETARSRDETWQTGLGLNYFVNRYVYFSAAYTHERLRSNLPIDEYDVNQVWLTLTLER